MWSSMLLSLVLLVWTSFLVLLLADAWVRLPNRPTDLASSSSSPLTSIFTFDLTHAWSHLCQLAHEIRVVYRLLNTSRLVHRWSIDNFSLLLLPTGESLTSTTFQDESDPRTSWCLKLFPAGRYESIADHISLYLVLRTSDKERVMCRGRMGLIDSTGQVTRVLPINAHPYRAGTSRGKPLIKRDDLFGHAAHLLPSDTLTLLVEFDYVKSVDTRVGKADEWQFGDWVPRLDLQTALNNLVDHGEYSDVTIRVGLRDFRLHRVILAAASPVFGAMLRHKMLERSTGQVVVEDMRPECFARVVDFIYAGRIPKIDSLDEGDQLMMAADKYQMEPLKAAMERVLEAQLNPESAISLLSLAERYNAIHLWNQVSLYIKTHAYLVMRSQQWACEVRRGSPIIQLFVKSLGQS